MSKTKQHLPENVDVTDIRDSFAPVDEPSAQDWYIADIDSAISALEDMNLTGHIAELKSAIKNLTELLEIAEKPF